MLNMGVIQPIIIGDAVASPAKILMRKFAVNTGLVRRRKREGKAKFYTLRRYCVVKLSSGTVHCTMVKVLCSAVRYCQGKAQFSAVKVKHSLVQSRQSAVRHSTGGIILFCPGNVKCRYGQVKFCVGIAGSGSVTVKL